MFIKPGSSYLKLLEALYPLSAVQCRCKGDLDIIVSVKVAAKKKKVAGKSEKAIELQLVNPYFKILGFRTKGPLHWKNLTLGNNFYYKGTTE